LAGLEIAVERFSNWASALPSRSLFYMNERVAVHAGSNTPPGVKLIEIRTADVLFDIHSILAAQCLLKSWRTRQLTDSLVASLEQWNLTTAATIARALVETASAWAVESRGVNNVWASVKSMPVNTPNDAMVVRDRLYHATIQLAWGTRIARIAK